MVLCLQQDLDLSANSLTDSAISDLMKSLLKNESMTALELQGNQFGDACCADIGQMLKQNTSLRTLG